MLKLEALNRGAPGAAVTSVKFHGKNAAGVVVASPPAGGLGRRTVSRPGKPSLDHVDAVWRGSFRCVRDLPSRAGRMELS